MKNEVDKKKNTWDSGRKMVKKTICIHTQGIKYAVKKVTAGAEAFYGTEHRDCFIWLRYNCSEVCASVICLRGTI